MGGKNESTTTQSQSSQTDPWGPAIPLLQNLLGQYGSLSTAPTADQQAAIQKLMQGAGSIPNFGDWGTGAIANLFSTSTDPQQGTLYGAYGNLTGNLSGVANPNNLNPYNTPGFADALKTATQDITNQVKGVYAGSGRSPSGAGAFSGSLARGLGQGLAPTIANQYNANVGNLMGANSQLYNAGANTATTSAALGQIPLQNALSALQNIGMLNTAYTSPGQSMLDASNSAYGLPFQNLAQLLNPLLMLGGMGGTSQGSGTATTTQPQNMWSNIMGGITGGLGLLKLLSDERMKQDIEKIGTTHDRQPIYRFRYRGSPTMHVGMLAQKVEKRHPHAVSEMGGMKMVDYKMATDKAAQMNQEAA